MPWGELFPAHAIVKLQPAIHLPTVLDIEAGEVVLIVELLEVPLLEIAHEAHLEVRRRIGIVVRGAADLVGHRSEGEAAVRLIVVGHVESAQLNVPAECDVVVAYDPVQVVVQGVVVAKPACKRGGRGAEIAADR